MCIDTHCHLDDPLLAERLPEVLAGGGAAGVTACIVPGVHPAGWRGILSLARRHHESPLLYPAFGVHPMHAHLLDDSALAELEELAPLAVAIGEIGLDYLAAPEKPVQRRAFLAQLRLALRHDLPVLIHCRKAHGDLLEMLRAEGEGRLRGVMHAFSGSVETAMECVRLGLSISLCGTLTYRNAVKPLTVARLVPLADLLLETDAPDLSPEPHRGEVNLPANILLTARKLAEVKGVTEEDVARATAENARRLFRLPPQGSTSRG